MLLLYGDHEQGQGVQAAVVFGGGRVQRFLDREPAGLWACLHIALMGLRSSQKKNAPVNAQNTITQH